MNDQDRNREQLEIRGSSSSLRHVEKEKPMVAKEVKEKAGELIAPETPESFESQEGVEFAEGKISEAVASDKDHAPQTGGSRRYTTDEIEAIRAKLLAALPPQEVMIKQIRKKLRRDEKKLTKRMSHLRKKAHTQAFHLTIVVAQLRRIREYFAMLAHATYEMIKHLWLKIVHGV